MSFNEMTIEHLKAYRASVEVYGTASELYEVEMRIKDLMAITKGCLFYLKKGEERKGGFYVKQH